ncbi:uncharacterized protein LAESUDRAFT_637900, partial [Laetiporus sulphureus 93-53]
TAAILLHSCETIPKPNGEVTHIGHGGYNLRDALHWKEALYIKYSRTHFHGLMHCLTISRILCIAANDYPFLTKYENNWVVADFLHVYLKNKSASTK